MNFENYLWQLYRTEDFIIIFINVKDNFTPVHHIMKGYPGRGEDQIVATTDKTKLTRKLRTLLPAILDSRLFTPFLQLLFPLLFSPISFLFLLFSLSILHLLFLSLFYLTFFVPSFMNLICYSFRFVFISEKKNILVQAGFKLTVCLPCRVYHCVYTSTKEKIQLYTSDIQSLHSGSSPRWLHRQGWTSNVM